MTARAAAREIVDDAGPAAPWLTLLHGATQHAGLFDAQVEHFRRSHRLLLVDLPGHGRSSAHPGPYGLVEYAAAVSAALDAAGVVRTHLWGTHTGAGVALLLAHERPALCASLVLDGAVLPGAYMPYVAFAIERARTTARAHGLPAALGEWFRECLWFDVIRAHPQTCRADAHWRLVSGFAGGPWLDPSVPAPVPALGNALGQIDVPALLLNGEHDVPEFLDAAERIATGLPRAAREIIPGGGGFPLWEFPVAVNALVERFLRALPD